MTGTEDRTKDSGQDRDGIGIKDRGLRLGQRLGVMAHRHEKAPQGLAYGAMFTI